MKTEPKEKQAAHTPGPWEAFLTDDNVFEIGHRGMTIARINPKSERFAHGANEANADLIAGAPELLAAAKAGEYLGDKLGAGVELPPAIIAEKLRLIRAAISKAEGC